MYSTPQGVWHTMDVSYDFTCKIDGTPWYTSLYTKTTIAMKCGKIVVLLLEQHRKLIFFTEKEVVCKYIHCFKRTFKLRLKTVAFPARPRPFLVKVLVRSFQPFTCLLNTNRLTVTSKIYIYRC